MTWEILLLLSTAGGSSADGGFAGGTVQSPLLGTAISPYSWAVIMQLFDW